LHAHQLAQPTYFGEAMLPRPLLSLNRSPSLSSLSVLLSRACAHHGHPSSSSCRCSRRHCFLLHPPPPWHVALCSALGTATSTMATSRSFAAVGFPLLRSLFVPTERISPSPARATPDAPLS
jgi:hypothetical protein